jgi:hypothetical protein
MEAADLILGPVFLMLLYGIAFMVRPMVTNHFTKQFFIPALSLKFVGAIGLGLVYQFYYHGGDTYNYYFHAKIIHMAFDYSSSAGWKLLMASGGEQDPETYHFTYHMNWYHKGSSEYTVARITAALGLLCMNNYSAIALMYAAITFTGMWAMFMTFAKIRPHVYKQLAWAIFYIPSGFFWGSGIMKDSLCMGALGWLFYALHRGAIEKKNILRSVLIGVAAAGLLANIKVYILLCFLPAALIWVFQANNDLIKNKLFRTLAKPLFFGAGAAMAFYATTNLTKGNEEYDLEKIGERSKITADYLYKTSEQQKGSGYKLGELDGSVGSMVKLAPQAIGTALFRPFIWEGRNPVMMLSALEAAFFLFFTFRQFRRTGVARTFAIIGQSPILLLCFLFSFGFAAAVGVTSNNFGTLVRYKIPLIPFYLGGLYILENLSRTNIATKPNARKQVAAAQRPQLA